MEDFSCWIAESASFAVHLVDTLPPLCGVWGGVSEDCEGDCRSDSAGAEASALDGQSSWAAAVLGCDCDPVPELEATLEARASKGGDAVGQVPGKGTTPTLAAGVDPQEVWCAST